MNIAFFCTGEGSFFRFVYLNLHLLNVDKLLLFSDRKCGVMEFAKDNAGDNRLQYRQIESKDSVEFETKSKEWLVRENVDYVLLSCNKILRYDLLEYYGENQKRMFNCHPALLPNYIGLGAVEKSYASQDLVYGATIHYVTREVDAGEPVARCVLRKRKEEFKTYAHRLFVNQAVSLLNFIYCLSVVGGDSLCPLDTMESLEDNRVLGSVGFNPVLRLSLNEVKFFRTDDMQFLVQ